MENLVRYYDGATKGGMENARLRSTEARLATVRREMQGAQAKNAARIDSVAQDFESMFLSEMLQTVFEDVKTDELTGGGNAEDIYRSMMVDEYGKMIAKTGGIGIADHVKRELIKLQEVH